MISLAMKHKQRCLDKVAMESVDSGEVALAPSPEGQSVQDSCRSEVITTALEQDLEFLSGVPDIAKKIEHKKQLLPKYLPHVEAYLEGGERYQNPVLVRCAMWALDVEEMEVALGLVDAVIEQQQLLPPHFKRDAPTFFAEGFAEWADRQFQKQQSGSPYIDEVAARLSDGRWPSTNDLVIGKVYKTAGLLEEQNGNLKEALAWFEKAQEANPNKAGVKTRIKTLQAKLQQG